MPTFYVLFAAAVLAGALVAVQGPTNAMLGKSLGSALQASLVSFVVGVIALAAVVAINGAKFDFNSARSLPWYAWIGGLYGAFFVVIAAWGTPRLGVTVLVAATLAGQMAAAMIMDHYGLLGLPRQPISIGRFVGIGLVVAGVMIVRRT